MCTKKLWQVDAITGKARVTLQDDSVIEGVSWGILPAEDDDGEDLGYEYLLFVMDMSKSEYVFLKEEDIKAVEAI